MIAVFSRWYAVLVVLLTLTPATGSGLVPIASAHADTIPVDLELVLAVDVSLSMDPDEQRFQRDGYIEALQDAEVMAAIKANGLGRIGVVYFEWAGAGIHKVTVPWSLIDGPPTAKAFTDRLTLAPLMRAQRTSISSALAQADGLLATSGFRGKRRVIDISGDGPNNDGSPVVQMRDAIIAKGVTINGLPIMIKQPSGWFDLPDLDHYYEDCVIGGFGSFVIAVRQKTEFSRAIKRKLLLEIAERRQQPAAGLPLVRIQSQSGQNQVARSDCLIGEKRWQQYMGGRRGGL